MCSSIRRYPVVHGNSCILIPARGSGRQGPRLLVLLLITVFSAQGRKEVCRKTSQQLASSQSELLSKLKLNTAPSSANSTNRSTSCQLKLDRRSARYLRNQRRRTNPQLLKSRASSKMVQEADPLDPRPRRIQRPRRTRQLLHWLEC